MYTYNIANLWVQSEIKLHTVTPCTATAPIDVRIVLDDSIELPETAVHFEDYGLADGDDFWFYGYGNLRFRVRGGNTISVKGSEGFSAADISLYLLGSGMGVIAFQRGLIPLHISGVAIGAQMLAITGPSGAGKSTLAAMMATHGFDHFTDDVAIIDPDQTPLLARSLPKGVKLMDQTAQVLGISLGDKVSDNFGLEKSYANGLSASSHFDLTLDRLYIISAEDAPEFAIIELFGAQKFQEISQAIYRENWLGGFFTPQQTFALIANLATKIQVFRFDRPRDFDQAEASAAFLVDHFESQKQ